MSAADARADALACYRAALAAVEPARLLRERLGRAGSRLVLGGEASHAGPVIVLAAGKAARASPHGATLPASDRP